MALSFAARIASVLALSLSMFLGAAVAQAQAWPSKPVRVVVPFSTGGTSDTVARIIAQQLTKQLGQSFIVDNRPGAGATIGAAEVARAPADGYTVMVHTITFTITQHVYDKLPYDGQKDFVPVALLLTSPLVLIAGPSTEFKTAEAFFQAVKANPGKYSFASTGKGSAPHLAFEMLMQQGGLKMLHVPFKGGGDAVNAVLAGHVDVGLSSPIDIVGLADGGRLRSIGSTAPKRTAALASLPTFAESGVPGYEFVHYTALLVRTGTPREIVGKLSENVIRALQAPEVRERITKNGDVPAGTMAEAADLFARSYPALGRAVRAGNIRAD